LCPAHSGLFQAMKKDECHFTNGTERVRYIERFIYNRQMYTMFDSDLGHFVGFTPYGDKEARYWSSLPDVLENRRTAVDWYCRSNYEIFPTFVTERRVPPSPFAVHSKSLPVHPSP
ncbi:HB2J protein, partial [Pycnonotus jocosus]|nr:HB2J protein [Pycnonotus jocosus]